LHKANPKILWKASEMKEKNRLRAVCPICEKEVQAILVEECQGGYKWLRGPFCALEFANPLKGAGKEGYDMWYKKGFWKPNEIIFKADYTYRLISPSLLPFHKKAINCILRLESLSRRLLDVGCGEGTFIKRMEELGFEVYGCDIAEEPIRFAREVYGLRNVIASRAEELPEDWKDFDVITAFEVLEHTENPLGFLKCLYNLLKPGGYLILSVPLSGQFRERTNPPEHLTRWNLKALKLAIEKAGFLKEEYRTFSSLYFYYKWKYFLDFILPESLKTWYRHLQEGRQGEMMSSKRGSREKSRQNMLKNLFKLGIKWIGRICLFPFFGLFYPFGSMFLPKTRVLITRKPL